jgi:spermidine/putrescine transport system substrate-binding protein
VWDKFKTIENTSFDGKVHFVPWDCGNASILYRTDLVDPADVAPESWNLLFNEKYAGKLSMYDTDTTFVEIAARVLGYDNLYTLSDEQLAAIKPMLVKQREIMPFFWQDATQIEQALASGELVAAYAWNGSVTALKKQGLPVKYMNPKEGILTWVCGMVRHKNPPGDEQAAYDFIDAMLEPEVGKFMLTEYGYGHSNRKSYELVDPALLDELGMSDPETTFATADISGEAEEPYRSKYIELVNNVKAGID